MKTKAALLAICISCAGIGSLLAVSADVETADREKRNYIGCTPTFALMRMYGIAYARALDERLILTFVGGYTSFDWSPIPFLRNENWIYQNVYGGINVSCFPFSTRVFPAGLYAGLDLVPSLGFTTDRVTQEGLGVDLSFDVLTGYSWILFDFLKVSIDAFLNFNPPGLHLSGVNWNEANRWTVLPFFDINVGIVFYGTCRRSPPESPTRGGFL
jgi:hypothetical protein